MNETDWLTLSGTTARLTLHIQPGAKKTAVAGPHGDALKIRLAAPPVDGKANAALLAFLADCLKLPNRAVTLRSGDTSRRKVVEVQVGGLSAEAIRAALAAG
ncbi:hypothetical protein BXU06_15240 [Aquaspirillum sp. LM1]|jgi:uncharacterized protein (TIGR00251 family)|uniref:DUF167 domain-containing protein n=1 Tax=Aquaspirillum sp. LM1 TaxID=1938604 RepID=UPI0009839285|nr:DUF167 domain-containing protein [Aquaspirillum sp. LM1]AQR66250.1 hypothetical protein BXU06_15240 [Aquaspirillum sp. LM1]